MTWKHVAVVAGSAAAMGLLLYYLLKKEEKNKKKNSNSQMQSAEMPKNKRINVHDVTKEEVLLVLRDILRSQDKMKLIMKNLTKEILQNNLNFEKTYARVKEIQPEDPLEEYGISVNDFDSLLDKYQYDPNIKEEIGRIMGAPSLQSEIPFTKNISKDEIVEVHEFMLKVLSELVDAFKKSPNKQDYDMKIATIAIQALVGARVEDKFKLSSDEIEASVLHHHNSLLADNNFSQLNIQMQNVMSDLMAVQFPVF